MNPNFEEVWVYLSASPLTALTITLLAYLFGDWVYQKPEGCRLSILF